MSAAFYSRSSVRTVLMVLLAVLFGTAAAGQTQREKSLLDSQIHRCFRACARLDANAYLKLIPGEKVVRFFFARMYQNGTAAEQPQLIQLFRGSMVKGFADFYVKAVEAGINWNQCRIAAIQYQPSPLGEGADSLGIKEFSAGLLLHDQWTEQEFGARISCMLFDDTLAVITEAGPISLAPQGLDAWLNSETTETTATTDSTAVDTAYITTTIPPPALPGSLTSKDTFRGRWGKQAIVLTILGETSPERAVMYAQNGEILESMTLLPYTTGNGLTLFTTNTALWKLQREGRSIKARCIYYDQRPDVVFELKQTN